MNKAENDILRQIRFVAYMHVVIGYFVVVVDYPLP